MKIEGRVFLDGARRPYLIKKWGDEEKEWLFYWHPDHHWVSLRETNKDDNFPDNLTQTEQDIYLKEIVK